MTKAVELIDCVIEGVKTHGVMPNAYYKTLYPTLRKLGAKPDVLAKVKRAALPYKASVSNDNFANFIFIEFDRRFSRDPTGDIFFKEQAQYLRSLGLVPEWADREHQSIRARTIAQAKYDDEGVLI